MNKKHYFDEETIKAAVIEYQATNNKKILEPFIKNFYQIAQGEINTHKFYNYLTGIEDGTDLQQEAVCAIFISLKRFDASKRFKLFSYLSLTAKYCLIEYTKKISKRKKYFVTSKDITFLQEVRSQVSPYKNSNFVFKNVTNRTQQIIEIIQTIIQNFDINTFDIDILIYIMKNAKVSRLQLNFELNIIQNLLNRK